MIHLPLEDVLLNSIARHKAYLLVTQDAHITGYVQKRRPASGQYLSGVRVNNDVALTLEDFEIANQQNGILTGLGNAPVMLLNGILRDSIGGGRAGQMHNLYHGGDGHLILDRVQSLRCHHEGHLIKSRGHTGHIKNCYFDGGESNHSRVIDLPYGGDWVIENTILIQSPNASNNEIFSSGVEKGFAETSRITLNNVRVYGKKKRSVFSYQSNLKALPGKSVVEYIEGPGCEFHGCGSPWE